MLVPFLFLTRRLGRAPNRVAGDDQALHLHARRLAADARGGDRHRRARRPGDTHHLRPRPAELAARGGCRPARRTGSSCSSPPPSWSRCRPSRCTAGCPTATRRCRCRCWRSSRAILSKVAAYGFLRVVLPLFPDASAHFQELMLLIALASILYGSAMAFTTTDTRLILGYSSVAQLGFITLGIFSLQRHRAPRARCCRRSTTGSSSRPRSSSSRCSPRAPAARRTSATWAASRSARPCSPRCS